MLVFVDPAVTLSPGGGLSDLERAVAAAIVVCVRFDDCLEDWLPGDFRAFFALGFRMDDVVVLPGVPALLFVFKALPDGVLLDPAVVSPLPSESTDIAAVGDLSPVLYVAWRDAFCSLAAETIAALESDPNPYVKRFIICT